MTANQTKKLQLTKETVMLLSGVSFERLPDVRAARPTRTSGEPSCAAVSACEHACLGRR